MATAPATIPGPAIVSRRRLRRDIGVVGLLFTSVGSIIGSGWLFGALTATKIAGPAALLSWVIGGSAMILLALVHAELGGMYPVAGGSARFPHYAFGSLAGFAGGWFAFLGAVTTAPIEVEAALQYSSNYVSGLTTIHNGSVVLTATGYLVAAGLMLLFSVINVMGVKWLSETNKVAVWWKIAIPVLTVIAIGATAFHKSNFTAGGGFMPFGWKGVFTAVASGGVVFAYLGFEQAIQLGGESKNPRRNIPLAVIGSMLLGVVLYILLQIAFVGGLSPSSLAHGWTDVAFSGNGATYGPFAGLATALGLSWLATLLYIDAVISPGGTGLLYVGTSSRISFALARNRYIPRAFSELSPRGVPFLAIAFSFLCGMIVFLPFPGWQQLVGFISSATVLAYGTAPLALGALRREVPDHDRPFRLPGGTLLAPAAFIVANELILFSGWTVLWKLLVAILIGFALLAISAATSSRTTGRRSTGPRACGSLRTWSGSASCPTSGRSAARQTPFPSAGTYSRWPCSALRSTSWPCACDCRARRSSNASATSRLRPRPKLTSWRCRHRERGDQRAGRARSPRDREALVLGKDADCERPENRLGHQHAHQDHPDRCSIPTAQRRGRPRVPRWWTRRRLRGADCAQ